MKAVVAAFNQEKALVGAFSVITNLRMEIFEALLDTLTWKHLGAIFYKQLSWDTYITYIRSPAPMSAER